MISISEAREMMYLEPQRKRAWEEKKMQAKNKSTERPDWDSYFMTMTYLVAQRSLDKHTKHGCVVVDDSRSILSVGYNSPPRGCIDSDVPLERPQKYLFMEHSESNAITNAARCGTSLKGSVFYVTGPPCNDCFRKIINVGAIKIVHGPVLHKRSTEQIESIELMNRRKVSLTPIIEVVEYSTMDEVFKLLFRTTDYIDSKLTEQGDYGKEKC